jgi:hypothetical protein
MRRNIENGKSSPAAAIIRLLPLVVLAVAIAVVIPAWAQDGASRTAPGPQAGSQYWTRENMQSARPAMPTISGTPPAGVAPSGPSGPTGGSPGKAPTIQPNPGPSSK